MDEPIVRGGPLLGEHLGRLLHRPTHHHSKRTEGSKRERRGELERVRKRSRVTAWCTCSSGAVQLIALYWAGLRRRREASNGPTEECSAVQWCMGKGEDSPKRGWELGVERVEGGRWVKSSHAGHLQLPRILSMSSVKKSTMFGDPLAARGDGSVELHTPPANAGSASASASMPPTIESGNMLCRF